MPSPTLSALLPSGFVPAILGTIGVKLFVDVEDPRYSQSIITAVGISQVALILLHSIISGKIQRNLEEGVVVVREPFGDLIKISIQEYDKRELQDAFVKVTMMMCVVGALYYVWGWLLPLVFHGILQILYFVNHPLFKIYMQKKSATGKLKRPWVNESVELTEKMWSRWITGYTTQPSSVKGRVKGKNRKKMT